MTFRRVQEEREDIDLKREKLTDSMQTQAATVKALKEKVDQFKAVEKLETKRLVMEVSFAWAFFGERDREYQEKFTVGQYYLYKLHTFHDEASKFDVLTIFHNFL